MRVVWSTTFSLTLPLAAGRTSARWLYWFVVVVIRLVCAALAVHPFVQEGGAIYATSSTLTMTSCTLSGNTATVRTPATWMHDWLEWLMIVDVGSDDGFVVVGMGVGLSLIHI